MQESPSPHFITLCEIVKNIGGRVLILDAVSHDQMVAAVSHLPYLLSVSLANLAADLREKYPDLLQLAAGGFRDMTRVASGSTKMWTDICQTNKSQILPLIDQVIQNLQIFKNLISEDAILSKLERAREMRNTIPSGGKGLLDPLHEVRLIAKDEPGVLATLTRIIAESGINISDMEILKIREGEGGTIRLAFRLRSDAIQAMELLNQAGFNARLRE
jgi:prephenate dehydrogenase